MKYLVSQYELHCTDYTVEANNREHAIAKVVDNEGLLINSEYVEISQFGSTYEFLGLSKEQLNKYGVELDGSTVVSICNIKEDKK